MGEPASGASTSRRSSSARERHRHDGRRELSAAGLADRPRAARRSAAAARAGARALARRRSRSSRRRRTTRRGSRSQDMERAGVDVITDGEMRRESYSNRFATALDGVDLDEPGRRARPHRPREPGPERRRADPAHAAGRGARRRVPPLDHRPPDQDHRSRAVHDDAAGAERPLRRRSQPRACVRRGGQRGAARPQGGRRRRRADRRAVSPGPARRGARVRASRRSTARSRASRATRSCTRASATRTSSTTGCRGYPFLARARTTARDAPLARSSAAEPRPRACCARSPTRRSCWACSTSARSEVETPERRRRADPSGARGASPPERLVAAPDCGMKYLPRERAFRQARGDGRGRPIGLANPGKIAGAWPVR